jgi:hypothetical protein
MARKTKLNDIEEKVKKLKTGLNGDWEYRYIVTSNDSGFFGDEIIRGGVMKIEVVQDWSGISIDINAGQLWSKKKESGKILGLKKEIVWESYGNLRVQDGKASFIYFLDDLEEKAYTIVRDMFVVDEPDEFFLSFGTFDYYRRGEEKVTGRVEIRKMKDKSDLNWAPEGVKYKPKGAANGKLENDKLKFSPKKEKDSNSSYSHISVNRNEYVKILRASL